MSGPGIETSGADAGRRRDRPSPAAATVEAARWRSAVCLLLAAAAWYAVVGPRARLSQWSISADDNAAFTEALAWHAGRMDLPTTTDDPLHDRMHDTAWVAERGKAYNVFPPLVTILCCAITAVDRWIIRGPTGVIGPLWLVPIVWIPLWAAGYWAFRRALAPPWAAFFTFAWLAATANQPIAVWAGSGRLGYVNHLLAQTGVMLVAGDLLGRRRIWPAAVGLTIAAWSRQLTFFYAIPILAAAWAGPRRRRDLTIAIAACVWTLAPMLMLNALKFGSPFETGYRLIYEGRTDWLAERARQGVFSTRWLPDNLAVMIRRLPQASLTSQGPALSGHADGDSLIASTPIVLLALAAAPWWWTDRRRRWLMLATIPVLAGILMYHAPGFLSHGCHRFSMDFVPVWLVAASTRLVAPRWRWCTLGCTAWGLVYFQLLDRAGMM